MLSALLGNLGFVLGGRARASVAPNRAAPSLPAQLTLATAQVMSGRLRGGLSGLSGSETDYADDQRTPDILLQDLTAHAIPASWFRSSTAGLAPSQAAYYRGPVVLGRPRWGSSTRNRPRLVSSTLLPPTARTPTGQAMAAAYAAANPTRGRITDPFEEG
jgi:hypothetical protein